jgi:hypothetical protein
VHGSKVPQGAAQKNVAAQLFGTLGPAANGFGRQNIFCVFVSTEIESFGFTVIKI